MSDTPETETRVNLTGRSNASNILWLGRSRQGICEDIGARAAALRLRLMLSFRPSVADPDP
jgi:hypothetical protein